MKILALHCDYIEYKAVKIALKSIKELDETSKSKDFDSAQKSSIFDNLKIPKKIKEVLVVFTAVEKRDEESVEKSAELLVKNIKEIAEQVKPKAIVLYPYAHLSSQLASPNIAEGVLVEAEKILKKDKKYEIDRAPFGYYKEFELKCKGHPLAELSREFSISGEVGGKEKGKEEKKVEVKEKELTENERFNLLKKMTKQNMSFERGKNGLKSNAEIGRELDLFIGSEIIGGGLPLLTPRGATIKRELERFTIDEELKRGYLHTSTPVMAKADLYKISGHLQHYKDSMFLLKVGNEDFALRPMTCPFQFVIYKSKPRSYKELPIKYAEISQLFRNEKSGELMGLTRLRQFTLSDAHIICAPEQLEKQFEEVLDLVKYMMKNLGIKDIWYRFSKWDPKNKEKYIDNPKAWEESQKTMKKILDKLKVKCVEAENEAAFYGPKLDLQYKNIFGKEDTLITIQIDFALPERYDMVYTDKDNKEKRPMVIHRSSIGCTERTIAYLLEKTQGNLPTWLAPVQVRVLSFTDRNIKAAEKIYKRLEEEGIRADCDFVSTTVSDKIRNAELMKIPFTITIGDKEEEKGTIALKKRGKDEKPKFGVKLESFISEIKNEIKERK